MTLAHPLAVGLRAATLAAVVLGRRRKAQPIRWLRWLPLQDQYLRSTARFRLLRAGNQALGKSTVALADLLLHALGTHPHRPCETHGEFWILCASWSQSVAIQRKLHALIPPDAMKLGTVFTESRGFRGKNPAVEVRHKDGAYSLVRFKTTQQGALNLAGATIAGALFDEPPSSESVYGEVASRVLATGGWISLALTPIGSGPLDWLRELVAAGQVEDLHSRLTPEALVPVGSTRPRRLPDGTVCDAAWIESVERRTPPSERDIRVHGDWQTREVGGYFASVFDLTRHVREVERSPDDKVVLGIDHGDRPGKQAAVLLLVDDSGEDPIVHLLDLYRGTTGLETPKDDAAGILAMLARNGLRWTDLHHAGGDRVHLPGSGRQKSNKDLAVQVAKLVKVPPDALRPPIHTVKRGEGRGPGSLTVGCRWLFHALASGRFTVEPRCASVIEAFPRVTLADDDRGDKDQIDAIRYGLDPWIFRQWKRGPSAPIRLF